MKIASFNAKRLGQSKVNDKDVLPYLIKIVSRYSVVLLLEVVDKSGKAMTKFLEELNQADINSEHPFKMVKSHYLGRDTYKEQYVFLYREDEVQLMDSYQYEDNQVGDVDVFAREPYAVRFSCPKTVVKDFAVIPVHTKPKDTQRELNELHDVVIAVSSKWDTKNIMIMGDFNADGPYMSSRRRKQISIYSDPDYHWLIDENEDTTASNKNENTYDRIVVYGDAMLNAVIPNSAKSFNFQTSFSLSDEQALGISDHYPVEVEISEGTSPGNKSTGGQTKREKSAPEKKQSKPPTRKRKPPASASQGAAKSRRK